MTSNILLETPRLRLRRFERQDADSIYALDNDAEVMTYINGGIETPRTIVDCEIMPVMLAYDDDQPGLGFWALELRESRLFWDGYAGTRSKRRAWVIVFVVRTTWAPVDGDDLEFVLSRKEIVNGNG